MASVQWKPGAQEASYVVAAMLDASANQYYSTKESEPDVLIVYSSTDAFVTGGGWMWDAKSSGHGNFGFVVSRYEHLPR